MPPSGIDQRSLKVEPADRAHALPAHFYCDPAILAAEHERVFARSWQLLAPADLVREPGDHAVSQIGRTPVLVVRDPQQCLHGLHNVCRHRAGPLALENGRGARALHCKYHGWTYSLDGQLRAAPEMQEAQDFEVSKICLPRFRVEAWQDLVFGTLDAAGPGLSEVLEGIAARAGEIFSRPLSYVRRVQYELDCNWKVYVDNYLEGYHLPHIHPELNRLLDYRSYQTECSRWSSLQHAPLEDASGLYGNGGAYYFFVFPNTMLNILPGRLQTNRVIPLGVDRCRVDFDYYYADLPADEQTLARQDQDQAFSDRVQAEDATICAAVQKGLASGSYVSGRLSPSRERGVKHFHDLLRTAYATAS